MKRFLPSLFLLICLIVIGAEPIQWEKAKEIASGIQLVSWAEKMPRLQKIHCVRIDLKTPGIGFKATGRDALWGQPMPDYPKLKVYTKRQTTPKFLQELRDQKLNAVLAVNTAPWIPWEDPFTHAYAYPSGIAISEGVLISCRNENAPTFVIRKNGQPDILDALPAAQQPDIQFAFSGFSRILRGGKITPGAQHDTSTHPRTGCALSADRRYLYFLCIDGRQPQWSMGATTGEMAQIFINAGAADALNLDGGGSMTLCYIDAATGKIVRPTRHKSVNYNRPVALNFAVYFK